MDDDHLVHKLIVNDSIHNNNLMLVILNCGIAIIADQLNLGSATKAGAKAWKQRQLKAFAFFGAGGKALNPWIDI